MPMLPAHDHELLAFRCNVCGADAASPPHELERETPSCPRCGSSVRYRAIVHALSVVLFGRSFVLPELPRRPDFRGVGLSDWHGYATGLASRLGYRNTFLHREPRLDLTDPPPELRGTLDFLVCCDVLEHVAPPVERAFAGMFELLRPGGALVLTVPYSPGPHRPGLDLLERFPELAEYAVVDVRGRPLLVNRTRDGRWQVTDDLVFHGGPGETLELRVFSRDAVVRHLEAAGFAAVVECADDIEEHGIVWPKRWSAPFVARRPPLRSGARRR